MGSQGISVGCSSRWQALRFDWADLGHIKRDICSMDRETLGFDAMRPWMRELPLDSRKLEKIVRSWSNRDRELFEQYIGEACEFFPLIKRDLESLGRDSVVKEIGSGLGLLSILVANEGFKVISYEPESSGFQLMSKFREALLSVWEGSTGSVVWINEKYGSSEEFIQPAAFVFAVNVVEHIEDWPRVVSQIFQMEKEDVRVRFVFPNYLYPYEPHFNMPTLFDKKLTGKVMRARILNSPIDDPQNFWNELSWPTGTQMKKICESYGLESIFSSESYESYLIRLRRDEQFRKRKGAAMLALMNFSLPVLVGIGKIMPPNHLPIIDVRISRVTL